MEKERILREDLIEKRPPLYVYKAKLGKIEVTLSEIIPFITTERVAILDFIEIIKNFSKMECKDVAKIIDVKKKGIRILILEELIEGKNLESLRNRNISIEPDDAILLIYSITKAFQKFHANDIYGLGIEPKNIIVHGLKNITILHPLFPIAEKYFRKTEKPQILNPRYISPEQIKKNTFNEKCDLFNIGILLFEILNNIYPFSGFSYQLLDFRKRVPYCLRYITERLLNINPSQRFTSCHDFLEELNICRKNLREEIIALEKDVIEKEISAEKEIHEKHKEKLRGTKREEIKLKRVTKRKKERREPVKIKKPPRVRAIHKKRQIPHQTKIIITSISILLLILLIIFIPHLIRMVNPNNIDTITVDRNIVEAKDNTEKILWKFKTGSDISFSKAIDIDNDNRKEVILGTDFLMTDENGLKTPGRDNAKMYILNENGKCIYRKEIGMQSIYPGGSSQWSVYDIQLLDIDRDMHIDFISFAITEDNSDCIIFTRTHKGRISNFWHTGKVDILLLSSSQGDELELICGGVNMRIGEKPVVFALSTNEYNDQSPPWGGNLSNRVNGLLWYKFLPGGGTILRIEEKDSISFIVETEKGIEKSYVREGIEIVKTDTTEEMLKEREEKYLNCFNEFEKGMEHERENNFESAIASLNNIINKNIEDDAFNAALYYLKGRLLYREKKWKLSTSAFYNAKKQDPLFYEAFNMLGDVYSERVQFDNATSSFKKAYNLSGKETYYYKMIDSYTAQGKYKTARNLLRKVEKKVTDRNLFLFEIAKVAREDGDFRTAAIAFEKMIEINPKNLISYILLADTYAELNENIEKSDSLFDLTIKKDSSLYYENIETDAWILYRKSRFDEAFQLINKAIEREEGRKETSVIARRKLPRIYYRKAIIAQPIGKKEEKEEAIFHLRSSKFCKGYIKRQLNYLLGSPE